MEILCSFRLVLGGKTGKETLKSSRLKFLEKFLANNFGLSGAEANTFRPLNRGGTADLPLLRTLVAFCQKFWEPSFWEVIYSFSSISNFGSFKKLCATITNLSKLYFGFRRFTLLVQMKESDFYELWYINQFKPEPTHKIH